MPASNLRKSHSLLRLNPSHTSVKPAQTSSTLASESFSYLHQTCANLNHSCVWILLKQASNLHKPHSLFCLNPSHACIKPAQTSLTAASESFSYKHQTCTNLNHSCVWIFPCLHQTCANLTDSCVWIALMDASNLHKPHPLLRLNPSHTTIKPAQTSPTLAFESFPCLHQTCANLTHSCISILLIQVSNLNKPHPLLRLNHSHTSVTPAQTSPTPASESFSYKHQSCTNFTHSCVWIILILASNLRKPHPLLRLNPSHTSFKLAQTSPTLASHACIWILHILNPSHAYIKPAKTSLTPASESSHTSIKPAQTAPTHASESLSCLHKTCTNLTHSCDWIIIMLASNLHKPHPLLRLNPFHGCIKPALTSSTPLQTSPTPASESVTYRHQTCTKISHSWVWILLMLE